MKKIYSPNQQEFEPMTKITVTPKKVYVSDKEDSLVSLVEKTQIIPVEIEKSEAEIEWDRPERQYGRTVSRNVEIMGDLIWRYSRTDEMAEKMKAQHTDWLVVMDRMKRIMQLCDVDSPLNYYAIHDLDPIKQKIIQRELEVIRGRYKLEEYSNGFTILENWYVQYGDHK